MPVCRQHKCSSSDTACMRLMLCFCGSKGSLIALLQGGSHKQLCQGQFCPVQALKPSCSDAGSQAEA